MSPKDRATAIILANACAGATAASLLANTFVGDLIVLAPMIRRMVGRVAEACGKNLDPRAASSLATRLAGPASGKYLAGKLLAWIPFAGNQADAEAVFEITQVVGWGAFGMFDGGMSREEALRFGRSQTISHGRLDAIVARMPPSDRTRYEALERVIGKMGTPRSEKSSAAREMARLVIKTSPEVPHPIPETTQKRRRTWP